MTQDEIDDAVIAKEASDQERALAEGWHLVAQAQEAIEFCSDVARMLAVWRAEHPDAAETIPLQEVEKLARESGV